MKQWVRVIEVVYVSQSMYFFLVSLKHSNLHPPLARYHVKRHNLVANPSPEIKANPRIKLSPKYFLLQCTVSQENYDDAP